jgi:serine/threonine protein kinase
VHDIFDDGLKWYIVMDCLKGVSLYDFMMDENKAMKKSEKLVQYVFSELCKGLRMLHDLRIAHRDIKLENIFI